MLSWVAAEELVGALARRDHLQPGVLHGAGEAQERGRRGAEGRLLGHLHRQREQLGDLARADRDTREVEPARAGEEVLVGALVEARVLEADSEGVERLVHLLECVSDDGRGVEPAAQVGGDRDVRTQAQPRRVGEERVELLR